MPENTAAIKVGRLLEVCGDAGYRSATEVDKLFDQLDAVVAKLLPPRLRVSVIDWRRCPVMAPEAAERIVQRMMALNGHTVRSVALARPDAPVAVLQFVRLIREARLPDRKLFFDPNEVVTWLGEVLTPPETQRLREFLIEPRT